MIQKYLYGVPFDTESVIAPIPASQGEPPVGTVKTSESGFCFACPLAKGDRVYGLGEANRGINKRGFVYVSDNVDDGLHTENKQRMYAAHNFIVISGQQNLGLFFDYPARIRFDIGFTRRDWLEVTCERADLALYVITGLRCGQAVPGHHRPQLHPAQICLWLWPEPLRLQDPGRL